MIIAIRPEKVSKLFVLSFTAGPKKPPRLSLRICLTGLIVDASCAIVRTGGPTGPGVDCLGLTSGDSPEITPQTTTLTFGDSPKVISWGLTFGDSPKITPITFEC